MKKLFAMVALALLVGAPAAHACTINATSTVEAATDPAFDGYWCYTVTMDWSTTQSLSHLSVFLEMADLACKCEEGLFAFGTPAGSSTGVEDGVSCSLDYYGEYLCYGDPSLPPELAGPTVKWDPIAEPCDAGSTGSGTFVFYSLMAPGEAGTHPDAIAIKNGQNVCTGDIVGQLPANDCAVTTESSAWGKLKSLFE